LAGIGIIYLPEAEAAVETQLGLCLGKYSRVPEPLIFVTKLVAFFNVEGWARLSHPKTAEEKKRGDFFGFSCTAYGIVKMRSDGTRLFVATFR
jgi:hypothetical protein